MSVTAGITGLTPNMTYHYRVTASNTAGTENGTNVSFTTPPITLTITLPLDGATINRSDVMVKGTVTNTTGNETGVSVNGAITVAYNGEFIVNHLPLEEGDNTIIASATDTDGYTATVSITVNAVTTDPHVTLRANIESGIPPLTTYFSVSTEIPNAVTTYEFDAEGDGTIDYTGATFDNISVTYSAEGIYYPEITVTDDQGITYTDTIAIVVLNQAELETLFENIWEAVKTPLMAGDIDTALTHFVDGNKDRYMDTFTGLGATELNSILSSFEDFEIYTQTGQMAECGLIRTETSGIFSYPIIFVKDENGIWKVYGF